MKTSVKTIYVIVGKNKEGETREKEQENLKKAEETKVFLEKFFNRTFLIEERQKTVYEIEKGDKVHWINNNIVDINRTDVITKVFTNMYGDTAYNTKELNGDKIGRASRKDLLLIM